MATLKNMIRVGADVRQIARLLQAKAPENHMLAYITPEEAQLLKDRGGSGMPDAETGVPTFAPAFDYGSTETPVYDYGPAPTEQFVPPQETSSYYQQAESARVAAPAPTSEFFNYQPVGEPGVRLGSTSGVQTGGFDMAPKINIPPSPTYGVTGGKALSELTGAIPPGEKNIMARLAETTGLKEETLARLGLGGIQAIIGARASTKAAEQGQRGKAEIQALAQPFQARGAELQRQAQAGELTPVARQQLQAAQAQAAQAASSRGGVGAQQSAARVEAIRNQLLQQQNDYGMKLTSIGDQITLGAIRTGLQADQYANQLTSSYFNNIMRTLAGTPTVTQTTQTTTTGGS
jgi:hypothetical protein